MLLDVECPSGVVEGELITVQAADGLSFEVALPPGVSPGDTFQVEIEVPADGTGDSIACPPLKTAAASQRERALSLHVQRCSFIAGGAAQQPNAESVLEDAVQANRLQPQDAAALKAILRALHEFEALDDFINEKSIEFEHYVRGGEQQLEWTILHDKYVQMVETKVADHLEARVLDLLGSVSTCSDAFRHVQMRLDAFRYTHISNIFPIVSFKVRVL